MTQVTGRVTDAGGKGEAGVYVYAVPAGGARFGRSTGTHTDLTGRWWLALTPGQWTVRETGGSSHNVNVGELAINLDTPAVTSPAPTPTADDLVRFLSRRRATREEA
jgi:hypothetical protein